MLIHAVRAECELYEILIRQSVDYRDCLDEGVARDTIDKILDALRRVRRGAGRRLERLEA